jgi:hypothetical protein
MQLVEAAYVNFKISTCWLGMLEIMQINLNLILSLSPRTSEPNNLGRKA